MPIFTIETPAGKQLTIEAPDEANAIAGAQQWHAENSSPPDALPDVAKSAGIGVAKGAIGLAGMGGDVRELVASGAGKVGGWFGANPENVGAIARHGLRNLPAGIGGFLSGPGSADIQKGVESVTGDFYKPKTTAGEYAQTIGEFAPAGLAGPGGLARRALTQVVAPAVASETAGQVFKGTEAEPYARVGGALAGGGLAAIRRAPEEMLPSNAQIRAAGTAGYEHPAVAAVTIRPDSVERLADRITSDLNRRGQLPTVAGGTHEALDGLRNTGNMQGLPQGVASVPEIRAVRMSLSEMGKELNIKTGLPTPNANAANLAGRQIDHYLNHLQQPELLTGNAQLASRILQDANRNWAAASKSSMIDLQQMRADRQAGRSGSGSNIENSMRQKIDTIFGPGKETVAGLTAAERAMADQIVEGSGIRNVLRKVGKLGFNDGLTLMAHAAATLPSGGLNLPIGIAATIARKVGEGMTRREISRLEATIRGRSPEAVQWRAIQARINAGRPNPPLPAFQNAAISGLLAQPSLQLQEWPTTPPQSQ